MHDRGKGFSSLFRLIITVASNVRRLNDLLFAPLDYAIVART